MGGAKQKARMTVAEMAALLSTGLPLAVCVMLDTAAPRHITSGVGSGTATNTRTRARCVPFANHAHARKISSGRGTHAWA